MAPAAALPLAAIPARAATLAQNGRPDVSTIKTRPASKIEIVYKTPHGKPNGLDLTEEGLWVMDQGADNYISLIEPKSGKLIREFKPKNVRAVSGLGVDADGTMWVGSTYNRMIVHVDPKTTNTIAAFQTPGAGLHYSMEGDAPARASKLPEAYPVEAPVPTALPGNVSRLPTGRVPLDWDQAPPGTGSHCILIKGDTLYITVPNARTVFAVDKVKWVVKDFYLTPGNRPHDMTWGDASKTWVWASDSNLNAFYRTNISNGQITEVIQLPDDSPVIHGAKLVDGWMYCCDDKGWMFRFQM
jgi:streptogramin lyase